MAECTTKSTFTWSRLRFRVFPVEVTMFSFLFAMFFNSEIYQQYYYQRIAYMEVADNLSNDSNVTLPNTSLCFNQELIDNLTGNNATSVSVQTKVNTLNIIMDIGSLLPSGIVALIFGPFSDKVGRKPFLIVALSGQVVSNLISLIIVYFKLNLILFSAASLCVGLSGGFGIIFTVSFAYITDITPARWLTARIGLLVSTLFLGTAISSSISYRWISYTNCNFLPPAILLVVITIAGVLFTVFIPESLSKQGVGSNKRLDTLTKGLRLFFWPAHIGLHKFWKLWAVLLVMTITIINEVGNAEIMTYFLRNKPLLWTYDTVSTYVTVIAITTGSSLLVVLPLLVLIKLPDAVIALIGALFATGSYVFIALLRETWEMFLAGVLNSVGIVTGAVARSMAAKLVNKEEFGATFSFLSFAQLVASCISTLVFNSIYRPGTAGTKDDSIKSPEASFWIMGFLWATTFPILLTLLFSTCSCKRTAKSQDLDGEKENLLKNDNNLN